MAAGRTYKDASSTTQTAYVESDASSRDLPVYKIATNADGSAAATVGATTGLPIRPEKLSGAPTDVASVTNATASSTSTGNGAAIGGSGGSAVPGIFQVSAHPDNGSVIAIGGSSANAATGSTGGVPYWKGTPLYPGQTTIIATDDLRTWKFAVRTAGDSVVILKVAS